MKHPTKIYYLPTKDKTVTDILHQGISGKLKYRPSLGSPGNYQHAYATVSHDVDPVKTCDLFYDVIYKSIHTADRNYVKNGYGCGGEHRKIIATDDPKLTIEVPGTWDKPMPQLQQSLLKEFVDNPDGEYEVEYELNQSVEGYYKNGDPVKGETFYKEILKLNQDNIVNITSVKEKMIPLSKVKELCEGAYIAGSANELFHETNRGEEYTLVDWIRENL
tara:strand:+ start:10226 stop:10882 length:657 start_codon:yes stop_codon:yes gene_type:complete